MLLNTFADRVRYLRRLWGLTQPEIHKAGGPARTTQFRIESGDALPSDLTENTLKGLALALKCHWKWLETGQGKVWLEGVVPPKGGEDLLREDAVPSRPSASPDLVLGRYITDGPTDWVIVARAAAMVEHAIFGATLFQEKIRFNHAEAYRLVYIYLSKQKDPLAPVPFSAIKVLLSIVDEG